MSMKKTRRKWDGGSQERQRVSRSHQTVKCCRGQARKGLEGVHRRNLSHLEM